MKFTDVYCGWPGAVHDARVLRNSPLSHDAEGRTDDLFPGQTYIIGDAAYPLTTPKAMSLLTTPKAMSLLTPYLPNERSGHLWILLCLTPDDFTRQWGSSWTGKG